MATSRLAARLGLSDGEIELEWGETMAVKCSRCTHSEIIKARICGPGNMVEIGEYVVCQDGLNVLPLKKHLWRDGECSGYDERVEVGE